MSKIESKIEAILSIVDSIIEKQEQLGEVMLIVAYTYVVIFLVRACL